jgi:uncharacterized protein YkwD
VIIFPLVPVLKSRNRPALVALSVVLGVAVAAGGLLLLRAPSDDESLRITVPDTSYRPAAGNLSGAAPGAAPLNSAAPTGATPSSATAEAPAPAPRSPSSAPAGSPAPKPGSPESGSGDTSAANRVVTLVNKARATAGCRPLGVDTRLVDAAQSHSDDMADRAYFAHTTPDGVTFDRRIEQAGYPQPAAENIARGSTTADQTMDLWMKSPGHRQNILNCSFQRIGVGVDPEGWYWTQNFGY